MRVLLQIHLPMTERRKKPMKKFWNWKNQTETNSETQEQIQKSKQRKIEKINDNELVVHGVGINGLKEPENVLDAGNSGTTLRLLMGMLSAQNFFVTFTGDDSLRKRPMARVIKPLSKMGAQFVSRENSRLLPLAILPVEQIKAINYEMPMEKVMQVFEDSGAWNLPVVDDQKRYIGFVSKSKIFNSYRHVLVHFSNE